MKMSSGDSRAFWVLCTLLLLIGVYFGIRGRNALEKSSLVTTSSAENLRTESTSWMPDTILINQKASYLKQSTNTGRDPFADPPKAKPKPKSGKSGSKSTKPKAPKPKKLHPPTLRALLYDTVNPSAKLSTKKAVSGWLHVGDEFLGWTIIEISSKTVTVSKNGKTFELD